MKTIRCSMLPAYPDCARRAAAKQFRALIESAGFQLRQLFPSVGAAVGTATHKAVEVLLLQKRDGHAPRLDDGVDAGLAEFREEIAGGVEWDDSTSNLQTAEFQIRRMAAGFIPLVQRITPVLVEADLRATLAPGWELTGKIDIQDADADLHDLKTGALKRPYQAQQGGYSLLLQSNGHAVRELVIDYLKRERKTKPQPPVESHTYDKAVAERAAYATTQQIMRDVDAFERSSDPYEFAANPMSLMCSAKYCPAHGTAFCRLHADIQNTAARAVD